MKWLTNTPDPTLRDEELAGLLTRSLEDTPEETIKHHREYCAAHVIGDPKATKYFTVQQLRDMRLVGIYAAEQVIA